jgi:hypothetical protein
MAKDNYIRLTQRVRPAQHDSMTCSAEQVATAGLAPDSQLWFTTSRLTHKVAGY